MKLTSRQNVLLARLVALGEQVRESRLPIDILEILGFGSFFRGKPRPKDMDLVIRYARPPFPRYAAFQKILKDVCSNVEFQERYPRPQEAFLAQFDHRIKTQTAAKIQQLAPTDRDIFAAWLEPYSWPMLFPKVIGAFTAWEDPIGIMRRLIRRAFPNLNVISYLYPNLQPKDIGLRAGFTELVWSRANPDVVKNVMATQSPEILLRNIRLEHKNFDRQRFLLDATQTLLTARVKQLLGRPTQTYGGSIEQVLEQREIALDEMEVQAEMGLRYEYRAPAEIEHEPLAAALEVLRHEVNRRWETVDLLRDIAHLIGWFQQHYIGPPTTLAAFLFGELTQGKSNARKQVVREVLRELELFGIDP